LANGFQRLFAQLALLHNTYEIQLLMAAEHHAHTETVEQMASIC
jgi:hypothetical protein